MNTPCPHVPSPQVNLNFTHSSEKEQPFLKTYNRGSHNLVIEDLQAMHGPNWSLSLIFSFRIYTFISVSNLHQQEK